MKKNFLTLLVSVCLTASAQAADIVVTIKPLHALVQAVLGDTQRAAVLIEDAQSPHQYALRPSQARLLHNAKLVFFVHEEFETFLPHSIADGKTAQPMSAYPRVALLPARDLRKIGGGGDHDDHDDHKGHDDHDDHDKHGHDDHDDHGKHDDDHDDHKAHDDHDDHGHAHSDEDLHIWLDIGNAKAIARHLPHVLAQIAPQHRAIYDRNAKALVKRLDALDAKLKRALAPAAKQNFVVQHDAYQYLERRYGLQEPLALLQGHLPPSAGRLRDIRRQVQQRGIRCFFTEPQFSDGHMRSIVSSLGYDKAAIFVLDPLGSDIAAGQDMYFSLLTNLADSLRECLGG